MSEKFCLSYVFRGYTNRALTLNGEIKIYNLNTQLGAKKDFSCKANKKKMEILHQFIFLFLASCLISKVCQTGKKILVRTCFFFDFCKFFCEKFKQETNCSMFLNFRGISCLRS